MKIINFHSHDENAPIVSLTPEQYLHYEPKDNQRLTVGIHPWDTDKDLFDTWEVLARAIADPRVIAVGECGIDPLRGAGIDRQLTMLRHQLITANNAGLPVVLHVVRRCDLIVKLHHEIRPRVPWGIHSFRGKPDAARQLAREGIYMSIGRTFNVEAIKEIPDHLLLVETDELPNSELPTIIGAVAVARGTTPAYIEKIATRNLKRFYGL